MKKKTRVLREKETTKKKGVSKVSEKKGVSKPLDLELEDLKPKNLDKPHYNDWYSVINFQHEGKECLAKFAITEGTLMGQNTKLHFAEGPVSLKKEGDAQVLEENTNEINKIKPMEANAFKYSESSDAIKVELGDFTAICKKNERKIISKDENLGGELTFTPRGPPLWWGGNKNALCQITENTGVSGAETLNDVKGKLVVNGEEVEVEGRGLFERVWFGSLNFLELRQVDWIYSNFDQAYMFFCPVESVTSDGRPSRFVTGEIYIISEDDYLIAREVQVMPENWVYVKAAYKFIPTQHKVKVKTDKGELEMKATLSAYPQFSQTRRVDFLTLQNITGWYVLFFEPPTVFEGKFTYNDGKTIELTNGQGMNEQIRVSPL
ncbi:MAG: hypothetical protein WED07_00570 [Candidatus Freyarchaeum deiterrae]